MTRSLLRALSRKTLAARAKKQQIAGWHDMTKDELVSALAAHFRRNRGRNGHSAPRPPAARPEPVAGSLRANGRSNGDPSHGHPSHNGNGADPRNTFRSDPLNGRRMLNTAARMAPADGVRDSLVALAPAPCWIQVRWTLSRDTVLRAEAAMGTQWLRAIPVLRVFDVTRDDAGTAALTRIFDVEIHGNIDHWYLPVNDAPRTYKVQIGYRGPSGLFFVMAQSNRIQTPRPESYSLKPRGTERPRSSNGHREAPFELERQPSYDLRALPTSKQRSRRRPVPEGPPRAGEEAGTAAVPVELRLHAELIVHGTTDPHAELTLLGDRVPVSRDGTFSHRLSLPEGRQVIDAVVTTRNGCHQRTIVLGIERNTKELEPQWFDQIKP